MQSDHIYSSGAKKNFIVLTLFPNYDVELSFVWGYQERGHTGNKIRERKVGALIVTLPPYEFDHILCTLYFVRT